MFAGSGSRLTEAQQAWARSYWIWAWPNPDAARQLRSLELRARGPRFVLAGLSLGEVEESPLRLPGARTVRIDLEGTSAAEPLADLALEIDRGVATFVYPLSEQAIDAYLADPLKGFGEPVNAASSPAYARVAALPSATVTLRRGDAQLGHVAWNEIERGELNAGPARIKLVDPGRNWVRTQIIDVDTRRPVPCRVHFREERWSSTSRAASSPSRCGSG